MSLLAPDGRGLFCERGGFHLDPWEPVPLAIVTHAHGDHALPGCGTYLATEATAALLRRRIGPDAPIRVLDYREQIRVGDVEVSLHPAGHMLGAAQVRVEAGGQTWVFTGDYKRAPDPTCEPFEPVRCDVLITEATFALPIYRWPETAVVIDDVVRFWDEAREARRPALLFCWALGKAQRILAELASRVDRPVYAHGSVIGAADVYRAHGVRMLETRSATDAPKHELEGALILAPPSARGTNWIRRFARARAGFASGSMTVRGERRRRVIDRGFVLSDHADWPALLRTIDESGAGRVLATHGFSEPLARFVRESRGIEAGVLHTRYLGEGAPAGAPDAGSDEGAGDA